MTEGQHFMWNVNLMARYRFPFSFLYRRYDKFPYKSLYFYSRVNLF